MNFTNKTIAFVLLAAAVVLAGCGETKPTETTSGTAHELMPEDKAFVDLEVSHMLPPTDLHPYWRDVIGEGKVIELYVDGEPKWTWDGTRWREGGVSSPTRKHQWPLVDAIKDQRDSAERERDTLSKQLGGIYRRLVELEKRAGIRDAEVNKIPGAAP